MLRCNLDEKLSACNTALKGIDGWYVVGVCASITAIVILFLQYAVVFEFIEFIELKFLNANLHTGI